MRRSQKETVTSLIVNLPVFIKHSESGEWPKWLYRKSFFKDGFRFYNIYLETMGGPLARVESSRSGNHPRKEDKKRNRRRGNRTPAFTRKRGGVFGLKNK